MALITVKVFGLSPYVSIALAFVVSGATALFLYFFIIRVLQKRGSTYITLIISTLSFDIVMIGVLNILADYLSYSFHVPSRDFTLRSYDVLFFDIPLVLIVSVTVLCCLVLGLYLLLHKTKFGLLMRASIENTNLAQTRGINTNMVFCVSWFLSGGLGGIAGVLMSVWFQGDPYLSAIILPSVFAGSIVGGFTSIYGAIIGGFVIGISEIMGTDVLASIFGYWVIPYRAIIPFLFIIFTLLLSPKGLSHLIPKIISRIRGGHL